MRRLGLFGPLDLVSGQLGAQRVLRLFCHGAEGFGKKVSLDCDSVRCRWRIVFATARFTTEPCMRYQERLLVASKTLSCFLLPPSLLLNSLGIHLNADVARQTHRGKTSDLGKESEVAGSSTVDAEHNLKIVTEQQYPAVVHPLAVCWALGYIVVEKTCVSHFSMSDSRANEITSLKKLGSVSHRSDAIIFRVKRNRTIKTVTENFTATRIDTKTRTFKDDGQVQPHISIILIPELDPP